MFLHKLVIERVIAPFALRTRVNNRLDHPQLVWADRAGGFLIQHKFHLF